VKEFLSALSVAALLLTGCSFEPEKEYDPVEMQVWQSCIDAFVDENAGFYSSNEILIDRAVEACQKLTPRKY
jgi:hypothetical protein